MGGWPDVLDERHLNAAADLLDDPVPIFQPLRTLPATLLHGYPGIYNWRVSLFGERHLVDWRQAVAGPAVSDLIVFLETFNALGFMDDGQSPSITEETLIDSYILQLSAELRPVTTSHSMPVPSVKRFPPHVACTSSSTGSRALKNGSIGPRTDSLPVSNRSI